MSTRVKGHPPSATRRLGRWRRGTRPDLEHNMTVQIQRPLRGSRISSFYPIKTLPSLASLDSAFQLQEYISLLIRLDVHDVDAIVSLPGKKDEEGGKDKESEKEKDKEKFADDGLSTELEEKEKKAGNDVAVDEACWIYEQLRRLAQDLSHPLITTLQQECTRASCPEMKAGEWLYLCVAHGNDGAMEQCCAIDYILHTVDSATALLNSPRAFPSRLQIPPTSHRHFSSLARRLGRIFAHAYFHHREAFEQAEVESSLYARFLALTSRFDLVPPEFLVIPPARAVDEPGRCGDREIYRDGDREGRSERERDGVVQPPKLLAAALDPLRQAERSKDVHSETKKPDENQQNNEDAEESQWAHWSNGPIERAKSHSPPGLGKSSPSTNRSGSESPRKMGRHRTDTMVHSDATAFAERVAEGLAKAELEPEVGEVGPPIAPTPSEIEEVVGDGMKGPVPTPATEPESQAEAESSSPGESSSQPGSELAPQPETESEPVPMADDPDAAGSSTETPVEDAAIADPSEAQTPAGDAEVVEHIADTEHAAEDSSSSATEESEAEPIPSEAQLENGDEAAPVSEGEAPPEAHGVSESEANAADEEAATPATEPEAEAGASESEIEQTEDVPADTADADPSAAGSDDCVPAEKAEGADDKEDTKESPEEGVESSVEANEEPEPVEEP